MPSQTLSHAAEAIARSSGGGRSAEVFPQPCRAGQPTAGTDPRCSAVQNNALLLCQSGRPLPVTA